VVLEIAREIQFRGYTSPEAVSLTPWEGTVMRYLFPHPGALSSQVASATGLRSSNLSAVLRGLEQKRLIERVADPEDVRVFDGTIRHHLELADPAATEAQHWEALAAAALDETAAAFPAGLDTPSAPEARPSHAANTAASASRRACSGTRTCCCSTSPPKASTPPPPLDCSPACEPSTKAPRS
jgi:hypothetical protein